LRLKQTNGHVVDRVFWHHHLAIVRLQVLVHFSLHLIARTGFLRIDRFHEFRGNYAAGNKLQTLVARWAVVPCVGSFCPVGELCPNATPENTSAQQTARRSGFIRNSPSVARYWRLKY
jgi:hypothetical protein